MNNKNDGVDERIEGVRTEMTSKFSSLEERTPVIPEMMEFEALLHELEKKLAAVLKVKKTQEGFKSIITLSVYPGMRDEDIFLYNVKSLYYKILG